MLQLVYAVSIHLIAMHSGTRSCDQAQNWNGWRPVVFYPHPGISVHGDRKVHVLWAFGPYIVSEVSPAALHISGLVEFLKFGIAPEDIYKGCKVSAMHAFRLLGPVCHRGSKRHLSRTKPTKPAAFDTDVSSVREV
jgi:hypothetical protein